ncbi:MAG: hypothetical protein ACK4J0_01025 [Candidatus Anstonellaceae archaeon]
MKNRFIFTSIGLFILFLQTLFSQSSSYTPDIGLPAVQGEDLFNSSAYSSLSRFAIILVLVMIFIISLGYMAANLFRLGNILENIKIEIRQLLVGVIFALFLFGMAFFLDQIIQLQFKRSTFDFADQYLKKVICISTEANIKLEGLRLVLQYLSGLRARYYAYQFGWGFATLQFPGLDIVDRAIGLFNFILFPFTASVIVQTIGLQIIRTTAIALLLPAGIVLRFVPIFRDAGSFLIATAFVLFFALPFLYTIEGGVVLQMYKEDFNTEMCSGAKIGTNYTYQSFQFVKDISLNLLPNLEQDLFSFFQHISYLILQALILPAINMILIVSGIQTLTKFISMRLD